MMARHLDVIDVSRPWGVWVGNRRYGFLLGVVHASDYNAAMRAAKERWPDKRIGFIEEGEW